MNRRDRDAKAVFELLEPRVLLSGGASALGRSLVTVDWRGQSLTAVSDEWIVRFADVEQSSWGASAQVFSGALSGAAIEPLSSSSFGLLRTSGVSAADIDLWVAGRADVLYAEPNFILTAGDITPAAFPDDTSFSTQWALDNTGQSGGTINADIDAPEAWDITTGSSSVVIAVIDTGIDYTHPDLAGNIWTNPLEIPGNSIDDDGNGYIDDVRGWDFANGDNDPMDGDGHGTHVAGTIGAIGNNAKGVTGVSWNVTLMPLKFLGDDGYGTTFDAINAIDYATMMKRVYGVNIVATNNSWSGGGYSDAVRDAIIASGDEGILFIAAAGNGGNDGIGDNNDTTPTYPASYDPDNVISVAATDRYDQRAIFSNFGMASVDLAAPGVSIYSTLPGSTYGSLSGTSMAAPHVTGVAALLAASDPTATALEIKSAMLSAADPIPAMAGISLTGGRLNAYGALQALATTGPRVLSVQPGTSSPPTDQILITFTEPIRGATAVQSNFLLRAAGLDAEFDTGDDVVYTINQALQVSLPQPNQVQIDFATNLPLEMYRLTIVGTGTTPIHNLIGEALEGGTDHIHYFQIVAASGAYESNDSLGDATDTGLTGLGSAAFSAYLGDGYNGDADVDLYMVELADTGTITADIDAAQFGSSLDPILRLFDSNGLQLAVNDDTDGYDSYLRVVNRPAGTYYIGVSGYSNFGYDPNTPMSGSPGTTGSYDLYLSVSPGGGASGEVVLAGTQMTLGINADASLIATDPTMVGAVLEGNEFLSHGLPQASFSLAANGFTFQNNAPANASSAIDMSVSDISSGSSLAARGVGEILGLEITRTISFGGSDRHATITVTLDNVSGADRYGVAWLENLDPDQGWPLLDSFDTGNDVLFNGQYAEAVVYTDEFTEGLTMALGSGDSRAIASTEGLDVSNPFDILDSPADDGGIASDIAINLAFDIGTLGVGQSASFSYYLILDTSAAAARSAFESLIGGGQPYENNDSIAQATATGLTGGAATVSETFAAQIGDGAYGGLDVDIYAFDAVAGDTVTADINASQAGSSLDPILRLFDPAGNEIGVNDDTDGLDSFIQYTLPDGGTYYVGVSGYSNFDYNPLVGGSGEAGSTGDYDLILTLGPDATSTAEIHGVKWNDLDGNGLRHVTEPLLAGWTVYADLNGNGAYDPQASGTFYPGDVPMDIPDMQTVTSSLTVSGLVGSISDVDVALDITHSYDSDLDVYLISPSGTRVTLFSAIGDDGQDFTGTVMDDQAATSIAGGMAPFTGRYKPMGLLADFNNQNPNGLWTLEVSDVAGWDSGTLDSWSVTITVGEPSDVTDANGAFALTSLDAGMYVVREVPQVGWLQTAPATEYHQVTLAMGQVVEDIEFGNQRIPGDANGDGSVDLQDFGLLKANFGGSGEWADGDFNADGTIDLQDFGILKNNFGATGAAAGTVMAAGDADITASDYNKIATATVGAMPASMAQTPARITKPPRADSTALVPAVLFQVAPSDGEGTMADILGGREAAMRPVKVHAAAPVELSQSGPRGGLLAQGQTPSARRDYRVDILSARDALRTPAFDAVSLTPLSGDGLLDVLSPAELGVGL